MFFRWAYLYSIALLLEIVLIPNLSFAQDLAPRAYIVTPIHSNAVTLTYSFFNGNIQFEGTVPITGATARVSVPSISYSRSFSLFGRTSNFSAVLPYGIGNFRGTVAGAETMARRSGLFAPFFRVSVNLKGGPAMNFDEYAKRRQKTIVGVSFKFVPQAGQYNPAKLINLGDNRWAFNTEVGYSRRFGHWILDAYGGSWFFTRNTNFFPGANVQSQSPTGSFEGHLSYDFQPRLWVSIDSNFWFGGATSVNGVPNPSTYEKNSRVGITASAPISRHQSVKVNFNRGAYIRYGGNYTNVSVGWQFSWIGKP
jgi:Putative MetA-pathway of phenol degradation